VSDLNNPIRSASSSVGNHISTVEDLDWLLRSMINAFVLFQSVFDEKGNFVSYRFMYINKAYEDITGVKNDEVKGMTVHEVWPGTEDEWVNLYGHTAVTGEPLSFTQYHEPTGKLYHCKAYRPWDSCDRFCVIFEDITESHRQKEELESIRWLLEREPVDSFFQSMVPHYGDISELNPDGLIKTSVRTQHLNELVMEIMLLLETSMAIYEKNGQYAGRMVQSSWCTCLDDASRQLCGTDDNALALASGKWICHECHWSESALAAIKSRKQFDMKCACGIRLYAVPVLVKGEAVGAVNFGYGSPPSDKEELERVASLFEVDPDNLEQLGLNYRSRPPFIIEVAKRRLLNTAKLIGEVIERNMAEEALALSEVRFKSLFDSIRDGVAVYLPIDDGKDFQFVDINPAGQKISMVRNEDVVGRCLTDVFPSVAEMGLLKVMREVLKDGRTRSLPMTEYRDDRIEQWVENTIYLLESGYVVAVYQDTSAEHRAREELQTLNAELEKRVSNRTEELRSANHELKTFAYSVSHDLRAPLRAMDGFSRILEEEYSEILDKEGLRLLAVIRDNSRKMDRLISDILELSRVGRRELNLVEVDMRELAISVFENISSPDDRMNIHFTVEEIPPVMADRILMAQVWSNLISNSIKFTEPVENRIIVISGRTQADRVVYSITDNGIGFNEKYSHKLFQLFQTLHVDDRFQGTGVGLAIVDTIIKKHSGKIWADSLEPGASFHFSIQQKGRQNE
jgi:PAS domain S-box-containing protein